MFVLQPTVRSCHRPTRHAACCCSTAVGAGPTPWKNHSRIASIEALYLAHHILGRPTAGLLDAYRWAEEFLRANELKS
jgi:hypothetical protein